MSRRIRMSIGIGDSLFVVCFGPYRHMPNHLVSTL